LTAVALVAVAVVWAAWRAYGLWWCTDDAYISFRYARNLVDGLGLVYNAGERVEGFTNPLWTLWVACGLALGVAAERWANGWALICYLASTGALGWVGYRLSGSVVALVPVAALGAALHTDWAVFATGGLETSAFTFLLLGGWIVAIWNLSRPWVLGVAGIVLGLATLTRHDGVIPAVLLGICVLVWARPRLAASALYACGFAAAWLPLTLWRIAYYGDLFPNTAYAKSAHLAWYSQGLFYVSLYVERYWALFVGALLLLAAVIVHSATSPGVSENDRQRFRAGLSALLIATIYIAYVMRVGGDFMFARLLIPTTPFLLVVLQVGCVRLARWRRWAGLATAAVALCGLALTPTPISGTAFAGGVANEREHYAAEVDEMDRAAAVLEPYFAALPARVAIFGGEARLAYKARFDVAIECGGALTEPEIARRPLTERGRPGHEKYPSAIDLVEKRKAHFTFARAPAEQLLLNRFIPRVYVEFDDDVFGQVLHWDPVLMLELRRRGASFQDFTETLDVMLARFPTLPTEQRTRYFEMLERFYFRHVDDRVREAAFREALER
jgi:hypothetical protein